MTFCCVPSLVQFTRSQTIIEKLIQNSKTLLGWIEDNYAQILRIQTIVQDNQAAFGSPVAGSDCLKIAADRLQQHVDAHRNQGLLLSTTSEEEEDGGYG